MYWDWGNASTFLTEHDLVLVGYRGVDGSTILDCPEVTKAFKGSGELLAEESLKSIGQAWNTSSKRLTAQGVDINGYTMLEVIEDNEFVRKALGYKHINLLSASYGTRVAYLYGLKYPEHIFRSAMIGVNPPGHFVWNSKMIDDQLKYYSNLWAKDSIMSLRSKNLYANIKSVLDKMPSNWLFFSINPGKVKVVTSALLFQRNTAAMVFDAYVAAARGDPSGLALMSFVYNYVVPSMFIWGDLASKAVSADLDSAQDYCANMYSSDMPLGSTMNKLLWGPLSYGHWPIQQLPEKFRKVSQSDVETLLLSGSIDFSAPAEFATKELLPYLKNGKQIILSECGHVGDLLNVHPENTRRILKSYYETGVPDMSLNVYVPMDFKVSWGFPKIAKVVLGLLAFVVIALVSIIYWLIRKYRNRKAAVQCGKGD
jgi:pimeloyl-ACP methyl ester carboxylesterase